MFDFDAGKLLIIGVVALIVIGPKELPRVLRQVGQAVGRLRRMANEFQGQFMDAMKEADLQDIRNEMTKLGNDAQLSVNFDPARDIQAELTKAVDTPAVQAEALPAPTADFAIPHIATEPPVVEGETVASAGIAPLVEDAPATMPESLPDPEPAGSPAAEAKKRKVVVRRRRPASATDPSGPAAAPRYRNVRPRRHEVTEP